MTSIEIAFVSTQQEAEEFKKRGYCPIECAFGQNSVVDDLKMDHHGKDFGHLESVAIRAYRDFYAARKDNPYFIVNHIDADNMFAIASLARIVPHPQNPTNNKDLTGLAQTIAIMDTDPIGRNVLDLEGGDILTIWRSLYDKMNTDALTAISAIYEWRTLTLSPGTVRFSETAKQMVLKKKVTSVKEMQTKGRKDGNIFILSGTTVSGFNEWYDRNMDEDPHTIRGWKNPVVACLSAEWNSISIGCPNTQIAEELFGHGGLSNVFNRLNENEKYKNAGGFGGHAFVGGSPRGMTATEDDLKEVVKVVNNLITEKNRNNMHCFCQTDCNTHN